MSILPLIIPKKNFSNLSFNFCKTKYEKLLYVYFLQLPLIIKELIKHENTFNRKVFHEQEHSENRYQNFHSSWKATKIRHFSIVYTMKLSSNTYFIKCSERNISQCILALKQSHKIQYLFTLSYHFFTYFRFFLNFTLFHESLLLFHCLIDLVCSYI